MMQSTNTCTFRNVLQTCSIDKVIHSKPLSNTQRQTNLRCSSDERKDDHLKTNDDIEERYHTVCYSSYTLKEKI